MIGLVTLSERSSFSISDMSEDIEESTQPNTSTQVECECCNFMFSEVVAKGHTDPLAELQAAVTHYFNDHGPSTDLSAKLCWIIHSAMIAVEKEMQEPEWVILKDMRAVDLESKGEKPVDEHELLQLAKYYLSTSKEDWTMHGPEIYPGYRSSTSIGGEYSLEGAGDEVELVALVNTEVQISEWFDGVELMEE